MDEQLRCRWCTEVIGVYEPMIIFADGEMLETSRLRSPEPGGDCYHDACFQDAYVGSRLRRIVGRACCARPGGRDAAGARRRAHSGDRAAVGARR